MSDTAVAPTYNTCKQCGLQHIDIIVKKYGWKQFDTATFEEWKKAVFDHYRATGYPQYVYTDHQKAQTLRKLTKTDCAALVKGDIVGQSMYGLGLAWSYHPHHINVECNGMRTVADTWNNDDLLKKVIEKRIKYGSYMTDSGIRKSVRSFTGTQAVSNFRPTAAAAIYHELLPAEGGVTWDMSMGWGGRLLGAVACGKVHKYIGCDPATETFKGLTKMDADIKRLLPGRQLETSLHMVGSETAEMRAALEPNSVQLAFTSPPYFSCEKYSHEETQSWVKYKTTNAWLEDFIGQTLDNCEYALTPDGILAVNIADVDSYDGMCDQFLRFAELKGWQYIRTMKLSLSRMMGTRSKQTGTHKYEPIYVFRKPA